MSLLYPFNILFYLNELSFRGCYSIVQSQILFVNSNRGAAETTINFARGTETGYEIKKDTSTQDIISTTKYISVNGKYLAKVVQENGGTEQKYFHHVDIVGSIRAITDISGQVTASYEYEPFGLISVTDGEDDDNLGFAGKRLDGTGLSYFGGRYYDAEIGRFISRDPVRDGRNWFVYCNNNPLVYVDPTGYMLSPEQILDPNSPYYDEEYAKVFLANLLDIFGDPAAVEDYVMNILYPNGVYDNIDEAAIAFGMNTNPISIDIGVEHSSYIYAITDTYGNILGYSYADPIGGITDKSPVANIKGSGKNAVDEQGRKVVALIHTHGSYSYGKFDDENFSNKGNAWDGDASIMLKYDLPLYVVTPGGTLQEMTYAGTGEIKKFGSVLEREQLFNIRLVSNSMTKDPNFGL